MPRGVYSFAIASTILVTLPMPGVRADDHFEKSVRPLLVEHCLRCHGPDKQKGGLRVDSREALLTGGDTGAAIVPGKPDDSLFVQALKHDGLKMPPGKQLPAEQIAILAKWIEAGAVWGSKSTPTSNATGHAARKPGLITDADRGWWAFQKPTRPELPKAGANWAKTPIDHFHRAAARSGEVAARRGSEP